MITLTMRKSREVRPDWAPLAMGSAWKKARREPDGSITYQDGDFVWDYTKNEWAFSEQGRKAYGAEPETPLVAPLTAFAQCRTCGAPHQQAGGACRYCGSTV